MEDLIFDYVKGDMIQYEFVYIQTINVLKNICLYFKNLTKEKNLISSLGQIDTKDHAYTKTII